MRISDWSSDVCSSDLQAWQRVLAARGWLAPSWSKQWGGPGWGPLERFIYDEESALAGAPRANIPSIDLLGPVIIEFGTEDQKKRSEEHTSELQSLMRISYAVFCLKKKKTGQLYTN